MRRWRGLKALIHDAVDATTELVDEGHESTSRAVMRVLGAIEPIATPARVVDEVRRVTTRGVLGSVRAVNRAVEVITDAGISAAASRIEPGAESVVPLRSDAITTPDVIADAALGLINGAIGDRLHARKNGLDLGMQLRVGDAYVPLSDDERLVEALSELSPRAALFVHGLMTTEWSWCLEGEHYHGDPGASFGTLLARDLGITPIWARYNTGRHVSENGRLLSAVLERVVQARPGLEELILIGHSMGGLVIRSACHYAEKEGCTWIHKVQRVFCLGSPHHGAPLESFGRIAAGVLGAIDLPGTRIPARLLQARSSGIKDLGQGSLVDEDWLDRDPDAIRQENCREIPLVDHVTYFFLSATFTTDAAHPLGQLLGDLLVRAPSARGERLKHVTFPVETQGFGGVMHHQLQNHPAVYEVIRTALARA